MKACFPAAAALAAAALLAAAPSHASDGVIPINMDVVNAAGGFPYRITQPGSYRLTGPLVVGDLYLPAIAIEARNVTLDLNGFAITGPRCGPSRCHVGPTTANGISVIRYGATIVNGFVDNFNGSGIVGTQIIVQRVQARRNAYCGIVTGSGGVVQDVIANDNGFCGVSGQQAGSTLQRISARDNGSYQVHGGALLSGSALVGPVAFPGGVVSAGDNSCAPAIHLAPTKC